MKYWIVITVYLSSVVFAILGPWLVNDLGMILFEMGMNDGEGATVLDYLAALLFFVLTTPFVFVQDLATPPRILFALNGACWACAIWAAWMAWKGIRRRSGRGPRSP